MLKLRFFQELFHDHTEDQFNRMALDAVQFQMEENAIYADFVKGLGVDISAIKHYSGIPFLPVELFKTRKVYASPREPEIIFRSSGTTGMKRSTHEVADAILYRSSILESFSRFYGSPEDYLICALTPSPKEKPESSLAYMIDTLIQSGASPGSGFYLNNQSQLFEILQPSQSLSLRTQRSNLNQHPSTLIIGLTFALLDFAEQYPIQLADTIIMETGGMKGKRRELIREEIHEILKEAFGVDEIHSEYGMSEILSQAYSKGNGVFRAPPWMKILIRDVNDPLTRERHGRTGGINIIDLANIYSSPFIATQDLGKLNDDGSFEVLGRFDYSDLRGCNLMIE